MEGNGKATRHSLGLPVLKSRVAPFHPLLVFSDDLGKIIDQALARLVICEEDDG